jgi:hypothetical protein
MEIYFLSAWIVWRRKYASALRASAHLRQSRTACLGRYAFRDPPRRYAPPLPGGDVPLRLICITQIVLNYIMRKHPLPGGAF